jgi:periplasmic divalent cation tolerance protein
MRLIFATCTPDEAESIARTLLEERLVACANLIPGVTSLYWWDDEITLDEEVMMWMEAAAESVDAATERLRELHPAEVPKIVVLDPESVDPDYISWLREVTRPDERLEEP